MTFQLNKFVKNLRKRRTRAYCLGAAKTGTTTIAGIYRKRMTSMHEPLVRETTKFIIEYLQGKMSKSDCKVYLQKRDSKLKLELESSHPLGYIAPHIYDTFPDSKFIITIRNPYSWLRSRLDFHYAVNPKEWVAYRNFIWGRHHHKYNVAEKILESYNLFSIDAYLKQYSEQYKIIFNSLPIEQIFIVKTSELSGRVNEISKFLGLNSGVKALHLNKKKDNRNIIAKIDPSFVDERIDFHCQWIIKKYFK